MKRAPLLVLRPAKPIGEMTAAQRRAFARRLSRLLARAVGNALTRTDYYALLSPADLATPVGLFRVRRSGGGLYIESWTGGAWIDGPYTLGRYVYDGEPGAEAITEAEADRIRAQVSG